MKTRHVFAALVVAAASYTGGANAAEAETRLVKFGGSCYRMPLWNTQWFNSLKDPERAISLRFENPEVERAVPGYRAKKTASGTPDGALIVSLFKPAPSEAAQFEANRQQMHVSVWYAEGEYSRRKVKALRGTNLFRVYPLGGGNSWMVVSTRPDPVRRDTHLQKDYYLGSCHKSENTGERVCSTTVDQDGIHMSMQLLEDNLLLRRQVVAHLSEKLTRWRVPCEG